MSQAIEQSIADHQWDQARQLIEVALVDEPDSHWLLTRLGLTYYEQYDYQRALEIEERAFALAPNCPLILWDYAGSLDMLDRPQEALALYQQLIDRGIDSLANDECGEGRARARALYADSLYRMGLCLFALGQNDKAIEALQNHLDQRGPGCRSIYPIAEVRAKLAAIVVQAG